MYINIVSSTHGRANIYMYILTVDPDGVKIETHLLGILMGKFMSSFYLNLGKYSHSLCSFLFVSVSCFQV